MGKWLYNNCEFEFDPMDYDDAARYESAVAVYRDSTNSMDEHVSLSENIERGCGFYKTFFDSMFGEGTYNRLFGEKKNIRMCEDAFMSLITYVKKSGDEMFDRRIKFMDKYVPEASEASKSSKPS